MCLMKLMSHHQRETGPEPCPSWLPKPRSSARALRTLNLGTIASDLFSLRKGSHVAMPSLHSARTAAGVGAPQYLEVKVSGSE